MVYSPSCKGHPGLVLLQSRILSGVTLLSLGWPLPYSSCSPYPAVLRPSPHGQQSCQMRKWAELFQRLAEMQQEKWMLEEKVPSACPCLAFLGKEAGVAGD